MTLVVLCRQLSALVIAICLGACATNSAKPAAPAAAKDAPAATYRRTTRRESGMVTRTLLTYRPMLFDLPPAVQRDGRPRG